MKQTLERLALFGFLLAGPTAIIAIQTWSIIPLFVVPLSALLLWAVFRLVIKLRVGAGWNAPVKFRDEPIPEHWSDVVDSQVPLVKRHLKPEERERLFRYMQVFLHNVHFEGAGSFEITEEVKLTIAAHACLLLVNLNCGCYPRLRTVIVYERAYKPKESHLDMGSGRIAQRTSWRAGESWISGVVVLSWDSVRHGASNVLDGRNVVLHEFAHQLDQEDGVGDGVPASHLPSSIHTWARMIGIFHGRLQMANQKGRRTVLRKYGATNEAEFFAVATEAFFEKPRQLMRKQPELYAALDAFYNQKSRDT